ncbi:hypothetical protein CDAR_436691 [Caerostris darwini]|uniref:Uncharacterized protein n=1 Tax=Caerostris darwini TaxID=1538125 RepID=A0AAV4SEN7_9ARAC|nr:hypothetical protein CDAR_436691 [Caerostris darwini]
MRDVVLTSVTQTRKVANEIAFAGYQSLKQPDVFTDLLERVNHLSETHTTCSKNRARFYPWHRGHCYLPTGDGSRPSPTEKEISLRLEGMCVCVTYSLKAPKQRHLGGGGQGICWGMSELMLSKINIKRSRQQIFHHQLWMPARARMYVCMRALILLLWPNNLDPPPPPFLRAPSVYIFSTRRFGSLSGFVITNTLSFLSLSSFSTLGKERCTPTPTRLEKPTPFVYLHPRQ